MFPNLVHNLWRFVEVKVSRNDRYVETTSLTMATGKATINSGERASVLMSIEMLKRGFVVSMDSNVFGGCPTDSQI